MTLVLYSVSDKRNRIDKTLENGYTVSGNMKNALDVDNISINLQTEIETFTYNYCYIEELKRYYFIGTPEILPNGIITLPLKCDVLMSYKTAIENITGTIVKKDNANKFLSTYDKINDVRPTTQKIEFENNFNVDGNIIMVTIRGV